MALCELRPGGAEFEEPSMPSFRARKSRAGTATLGSEFLAHGLVELILTKEVDHDVRLHIVPVGLGGNPG